MTTRRPWLLAGLFCTAGLLHFVRPAFFVAIVPPYLPQPEALVFLSGVAECVLGALILFRATQRWAAWGLIALLLAVFPANVHMATHPEQFASIPQAVLWARLPLQGLLIWWVYGYARAALHR